MIPAEFLKTAGKRQEAGQPSFESAVRAWQKAPSKVTAKEVLAYLRPIISARSKDYPMVGPEITTAEMTTAALMGLKHYTPGKSSAKTWAISSMRSAKRPLLRKASPLRIPDSRLQLVGKANRAAEDSEDAGAQAKAMGIKPSKLALLRREVRPVLVASKEEVPHGESPPRETEVWRLLKHELSGKERRVHSMLTKNPKVSATAMAKTLKVSPSSVSYYKARIMRLFKRFTDGHER